MVFIRVCDFVCQISDLIQFAHVVSNSHDARRHVGGQIVPGLKELLDPAFGFVECGVQILNSSDAANQGPGLIIGQFNERAEQRFFGIGPVIELAEGAHHLTAMDAEDTI